MKNSKRAAKRLGFEYEGLFRNHMISRNENRDTAWFSIIDSEWNEKKKNINLKADLA
jgi:RimJ/RimL family protein N-acetyltransferase